MAVTGNATPSRVAQINGAGDDRALMLKLFAGEVLTAFEESNVMEPLHMVKTSETGKSKQFPVMGTATAKYHVPGENILESNNGYLNPIKSNEIVINADNFLISPVLIPDIDEVLNHYDERAPYATELGNALANNWDRTVLQVLNLAALQAGTVTGRPGGTVINKGATVATDGTVLAAALFQAAAQLDNNSVPAGNRYCAVRPEQYYEMVQSTDLINRQWGGSGAYSDGKVFRVAGIDIISTIHLPNTNIAAVTGANNTYSGDFTDTIATVWHQSAAGTLKWRGISLESEFYLAYKGTLLIAQYLMGHKWLRPEAVVKITKTAP